MSKIGKILVGSAALGIIILVAAIVGFSYFNFGKINNQTLDDKCGVVMNVLTNNISDKAAEADEILNNIVNDQNIARLVSEGNAEQLAIEQSSISRIDGIFAVYTDRSGNVIWQSDNSIKDISLSSALDGKSHSDYISNGKTISYQSMAPLSFGGQTVGAVVIGYDYSMLDYIDNVQKLTAGEATVFVGDVRLSTTIKGEDGKRAVGTTMKPEIAETVLKKGQNYIGDTDVQGNQVRVLYKPFLAKDGTVIGAVFAGQHTEQVHARFSRAIMIMLGVSIFLTAITLVLISLVNIKYVLTPVRKAASLMSEVEKGNLKVNLLNFTADNEIAEMTRAIDKTVNQLNGYIADITEQLGYMADGNFTNHSSIEYIGDFKEIKHSMDAIEGNLTQVLSDINKTSEELLQGTNQIAAGSQALASGAFTQAGTVEELSATIGDVAQKVGENAVTAQGVRDLSQGVNEKIELENQEIMEMMNAMGHIENSSNEIGKIIKTIDDIAFQTNILALNAAVEAARAGNAGKGFAVVADEVRNLANKSAEAAKETTVLIDSAIQAVSQGVKIAVSVKDNMQQVSDMSLQTNLLIDKISKQTEEEAKALKEINKGIDQISMVVQENSATAEESSASSQEIALQAQVLKGMVDKFVV